MNKTLKLYIPSVFSLICFFFYLSPWLIESNRFWMGFYIISVFWFIFASPVFIILKLIGISKLEQGSPAKRHHHVSLGIVIAGFVFILVAWSIGLAITV